MYVFIYHNMIESMVARYNNILTKHSKKEKKTYNAAMKFWSRRFKKVLGDSHPINLQLFTIIVNYCLTIIYNFHIRRLK